MCNRIRNKVSLVRQAGANPEDNLSKVDLEIFHMLPIVDLKMLNDALFHEISSEVTGSFVVIPNRILSYDEMKDKSEAHTISCAANDVPLKVANCGMNIQSSEQTVYEFLRHEDLHDNEMHESLASGEAKPVVANDDVDIDGLDQVEYPEDVPDDVAYVDDTEYVGGQPIIVDENEVELEVVNCDMNIRSSGQIVYELLRHEDLHYDNEIHESLASGEAKRAKPVADTVDSEDDVVYVGDIEKEGTENVCAKNNLEKPSRTVSSVDQVKVKSIE